MRGQAEDAVGGLSIISMSRAANWPLILFALAMSVAPLGFVEGDIPRDYPAPSYLARRARRRCPDARVIRPNANAFSIFMRNPPVVISLHSRIAAEFAVKDDLVLNGQVPRAGAPSA